MTLSELLTKITSEILNPIISFLLVLATVIFIWGVIQYVIGSRGDEKALENGKRIMIWGIAGLTIMASAWGIVAVICRFFETCN